MNFKKPEVETVGWIIITLWKTWNEAWKARNRRFKEEDRCMEWGGAILVHRRRLTRSVITLLYVERKIANYGSYLF
jgi:hypothetical protein